MKNFTHQTEMNEHLLRSGLNRYSDDEFDFPPEGRPLRRGKRRQKVARLRRMVEHHNKRMLLRDLIVDEFSMANDRDNSGYRRGRS